MLSVARCAFFLLIFKIKLMCVSPLTRQILQPVAQSLERLQSNEHSGCRGSLIPEIVSLKARLLRVIKTDPSTTLHSFTASVITGLVGAVNDRFHSVLTDLHCQVATAFHPLLGLAWTSASVNGFSQVETTSLRNTIKCKMLAILDSLEQRDLESAPTRTVTDEDNRRLFMSDDEDDSAAAVVASARVRLLESFLSPCEATAESDEDVLMKDRSAIWKSKHDRKSIFPNETYVEAFIKCNTGSSSSASVQLLFSQFTDLMRARRGSIMSDAAMEQVMFVRGNARKDC